MSVDSMKEFKYKAKTPEATIKNIRDILHENDIFVIENNWFKTDEYFSSVGLSMVDLPVSTAGKGANEKYALASAYAEFIERLQNLASLQMTIGMQKGKPFVFPDHKILSYKQCDDNLLTSMFEVDNPAKIKNLFNNDEEGVYNAYYHVNNGEIVYIPEKFISLAVGSNGMCAGNTPQEALIQGFSEIFERYIIIKIYEDENLVLPRIPDSVLQEIPQWHYIQLLKEEGFNVWVKDCTLGGKIPVYGVLIKKGDRALFNLGSAPDYRIAIERCFTELFQGVELDYLDDLLQPIVSLNSENKERTFSTSEKREKYQYYKFLRSAKGVIHPCVFDNSGNFKKEHLFVCNDLIGKETLQNMIEIIKSMGHQILIRDVSFLGFPSFQIYVQDMTEVTRIDEQDLALHMQHIPKARKTFYAIEKASKEEIRHLISTISSLLDYPYYEKEYLLRIIHNLTLSDDALINNLDPENVLILLYCYLEDYENAYQIALNYVQNNLSMEEFYNPSEHGTAHVCLLKYLECLKSGKTLTEAKKIISEDMGEHPAIEELYVTLEKPSTIIDNIGIPSCISCDSCSYRSICKTPRIFEVSKTLQKKIDHFIFDQKKIGEYIY